MKIYALLALFCLVPLHAADVFEPEKTWVFAAGILNWEDKKLGTWPDEGRVDQVMIDALKKRGVKEDRIVFIKNADATKEALVKKFNELLAKTAEGDTLLFYYAGHGGRDQNHDERTVTLLCYDSRPKKPDSYWKVSEVFDSLDKNFKGSRVLLTADCCHSGALADEAPKRSARVSYGVLTSAHATSRSTGNWTFTQCLVDMFQGNPLLDLDNNGQVTFQEAARYCEEEMSFCEQQLSCSATSGRWRSDTVMAQASGKKAARVGERCEGEEAGTWYKVKILDAKDGKLFITWIGWERKYDCWVEPARLRPFKPTLYEGGTVVEVEWDGVWYKAKILYNRLGMHFVHYEGYPSADDEWVPVKRIRLPKK
ncbi:MAG: caspase family protein [Planctomycetaceae bacterium]|nr:caspase family protein [Planctomycetaceae bacterium]